MFSADSRNICDSKNRTKDPEVGEFGDMARP